MSFISKRWKHFYHRASEVSSSLLRRNPIFGTTDLTTQLFDPIAHQDIKAGPPYVSNHSLHQHDPPESLLNEHVPMDSKAEFQRSLKTSPLPYTSTRTADTLFFSNSLFAVPKGLSLVHRRNYGSSTFSIDETNNIVPSTPSFKDIRRPSTDTLHSIAGDPRLFTYFMVGSLGVFTAMAAKSTVINFLASLSAAGDTLAQAQAEVDLSAIPLGKNIIVKWRGKPVFIRHRTPAEVEDARSVDLSTLRDPQTDEDRCKKPEWLVMLGICTHLGCVPNGEAGEYGGWYCPCHGSHYDISGRIRKGPAPANLEIPKYSFTEEEKIVIG